MVRSTLSACMHGITLSGVIAFAALPASAAPHPKDPGLADPLAAQPDVSKPPRPHPLDGAAEARPSRPEPVRRAPEPRKLPAPSRPTPAVATPQVNPVVVDPRPGTDRNTVKSGASEFRRLVEQGRVRLLNSDRDRSQIESLCANGFFAWPRSSAQPAPRISPEPDASEAAEPDGAVPGDRQRSDVSSAGAGTSEGAEPGHSGRLLVALRTVKAAPMTTEPPSEFFQMLNALASHSTERQPLVISSLLRPPYKTARYTMQSPTNPHALGIAVDISAFGGHTIVTSNPEEEVQAVLALLKSLAPGRYRMGMPKSPEPARTLDKAVPPQDAPGSDRSRPGAIGSAAVRRTALASRGGHRRDDGTSGSPARAQAADGKASQASAPVSTWPFFPPPQKSQDAQGKTVTLFGNEHYAAEQSLNDPRLRAALAEARRRGADVYALFPDGVNHVHLDVKLVP